MAQLVYLTIQSGQSVSSGFFVDRHDRAFMLEVPSMATAGAIRLEFSSVGTTGPWAPIFIAGAAFVGVWSGAGPGLGMKVAGVPAPYVRVTVTNSVADVSTFTLHPVPPS